MNKLYKLIVLLVVAVVALPFFISCSSDDGEVDEWSATYISLQRSDYLTIGRAFLYERQFGEVVGELPELKFGVKLQKPFSQDIKVYLKGVGSGFSSDQISFSQQEVVIKAGGISSEEVTASFKDWSFLPSDVDSCTFKINIDRIEAPQEVRISDLQKTVSATIKEKPFFAISEGQPINSELFPALDRPKKWKATLEKGDKIVGDASNLIDNSKTTIVSRDESGFWFTVDFGEKMALTGLCTYHVFNQNPAEVEISYSEDGLTWKRFGALKIVKYASTIWLSFGIPLNTRYLHYLRYDCK